MRAVVYCRVSTKEQIQNLSLDTQQRACEDFCNRNGYEVARVFIEQGESAKTANRTEFRKLLEFCRQHKKSLKAVVVYSINRFARSTHDHAVVTAHLRNLGITLKSVTEPITDTSSGRLMENVLAAFAQFDNDVRSERTIEGMRAAASFGRWPFVAPLGFKRALDDRGRARLVHDPAQGPLVRRAFEMLATGAHTQAEVLQVLTDLGLQTRRGKPVSQQTLQKILRNPFYTGRLASSLWTAEPMKGDFEPLISDDLFRRVQDVLDGRRPTASVYQRNHPDFPLRRFVRCGKCGHPITGARAKGKTGLRYAYYWCRTAQCRAIKATTTVRLETDFVRYLNRIAPKPRYLDLFLAIVGDAWNAMNADAQAATRAVSRKLDELRERKRRLVDAFVYQQAIDRSTFEQHTDQLDEEITLAEMRLEDARLDEIDLNGILNFARHLLEDVGRLWVEASSEQKQRLQKVIFPKGVEYLDGEFRTPEMSLIFSIFHAVEVPKEGEASPTGFEPS